MILSGKKILLFNPWIYDFAAFDFWIKPLGLLQLASVLQQYDLHIELIDCLDRFHPALQQLTDYSPAKLQANGAGKFIREQIQKPKVYSHIPRRYCRYGMPMQIVRNLLASLAEKPAAIFLTSTMTYWYPAVRDAANLLREYFPDVPIILGGIYTTLCPEHAKKNIAPDYLCTGAVETQLARLLWSIFGVNLPDFQFPKNFPRPLYDLYPDLRSIAIITSRGCPNHCSFCASGLLNPEYTRRTSSDVLDEILHWYRSRQVQHFAFFDDALLHKADNYIKPLLRELIANKIAINLHTPNGMQPRFIDAEFANLFYQAGGKTIKLSFETVNPARQKSMSAKITCRELESALTNLEKAGYDRNNIGVYVLMGLPDQDFAEVRESVDFVHNLGASVNLASFSPIPNTQEWQRAIDLGYWRPDDDLLMTNTSVFPVWSKRFGYQQCQEFVHSIVEKNKLQKFSAEDE